MDRNIDGADYLVKKHSEEVIKEREAAWKLHLALTKLKHKLGLNDDVQENWSEFPKTEKERRFLEELVRKYQKPKQEA